MSNLFFSLGGLPAHDSPEVAEMRFLRSVKGYTRLGKIINEVIRKEIEICGIKVVKSKYKQNWINHVERMENTRLSKHTPNINLEEEEIVDVLRKDGNASMPEQFKRPNPWKKMMMIMMNSITHIFRKYYI